VRHSNYRSPSKVKVDISPSYDAKYFPRAPVFLIKFLARQCQYSTGPTAGRPHIYHSQIHNDDAQAPPHSRTKRRGINKNTPREIPYLWRAGRCAKIIHTAAAARASVERRDKVAVDTKFFVSGPTSNYQSPAGKHTCVCAWRIFFWTMPVIILVQIFLLYKCQNGRQ
jgi:hypothetical protein